MVRQGIEMGQVVDDRRIQTEPEGAVDLVDEFDTRDRVETQIAEAHPAVQRSRLDVQLVAQTEGHGPPQVLGLQGGDRRSGRDGRRRRGDGRRGCIHRARLVAGRFFEVRVLVALVFAIIAEEATDPRLHLGMAEGLAMHTQLFGDDGGEPGEFFAREAVLERPQRVVGDPGQRPCQRDGLVQHPGLRLEQDVGATLLEIGPAIGGGRHHHLHRQRPAELVGQDQGGPQSGREPVLGEDRAVEPLFGHDDHVGIESEHQSAAGRMPLDGGDHRHPALQEALENELHVGKGGHISGEGQQLLARAAHREHLVATRDDHDPDARVALDLIETVHQPVQQGLGEHIAVGAILHAHDQDAGVEALHPDLGPGLEMPGRGQPVCRVHDGPCSRRLGDRCGRRPVRRRLARHETPVPVAIREEGIARQQRHAMGNAPWMEDAPVDLSPRHPGPRDRP